MDYEPLLREMYAKIAVIEERTRTLPQLEARVSSLERTRAKLLAIATLMGALVGGIVSLVKAKIQ